ncbi:type III restriction-modification system endonuclease [Haemophilus parainfluenzae]|uniref:type III restriction-modification system endonuclease n=1 Tax=Haemophilus parainfluenzae TaxID=729 RepID=UPI002E36AFFB|nr:DEAD/DEAH box helicase family protein [Haemophilus parainfluenzae]
MDIKFRTLNYQLAATQAVVNCFVGQSKSDGNRYMLDKGRRKANNSLQIDFINDQQGETYTDIAFGNAPIQDMDRVLSNVQEQQLAAGLTRSETLVVDDNGKGKNLTSSQLNLNIEMETGTGKTYCYIRTMFELNKQYGWSKFIIVVPSIAIREGVYKSLEMMADHFHQIYQKKARFFIYDSKALHHLESFSADGGINVMVINVQAFNATGKDARRIYEKLDEFQSRRPIDVISKNRPILILDEPQKMQADKTLESLANFKPLFILRYSATHKRDYNLVYRLDALDAYNQKLVKKITVKGIEVQGLTGTNGYLYLQSIELSKQAPVAYLELEVKTKNGFSRKIRKVKKGDDLYVLSNNSTQYSDRYVITDINGLNNTVEFANGLTLGVLEAYGSVDEKLKRTIQIRETIRSHLQKEQELFAKGIKVLSLFFIDEVAKYRQYDENNNVIDGEYVEIFKQQYEQVVDEFIEKYLEDSPYIQHLKNIDVNKTHNGYFSIDKKSKRLVDPDMKDKNSESAPISNDSDAYDLILKDKERLLSFDEPTRFIFSHSALREGWDNPNVFTICTLKHSDNTISRRQEVGRGLRLAVNKDGERMDAIRFGENSQVIHQINNLTVVTDESYKDFITSLQKEMLESLSSRPTQATEAFFKGKQIVLINGDKREITDQEARKIYKYLLRNDYIDDNDHIVEKYHQDKANDVLAPLDSALEDIAPQVFKLIDSVLDRSLLNDMVDDGSKRVTNSLNDNFNRAEFKALWKKINQKASYQIQLDSKKLIQDSIAQIQQASKERNDKFVETLSYKLATGSQKDEMRHHDLEVRETFGTYETKTEQASISAYSQVRYDLVGDIAENTQLTRKTVVEILKGISSVIFNQFKNNPEAFIREVSQIINSQQASMALQHLNYQLLGSGYPDSEIFTTNLVANDAYKTKNHIWDYVTTDSKVEETFAKELDAAKEVLVYAKLPDNFKIPTPFGSYNPDWAIAFDTALVKEIYFVAETKGSILSEDLKLKERNKIESAKRFFETLNAQSLGNDKVQYKVVSNIDELMRVVLGKQ